MRNFTTAKEVRNELFDAFLYFVDGDDFLSTFKYKDTTYRIETHQTQNPDLKLSVPFGGPTWTMLHDLDTGRPVVNSTRYSSMDLDKFLVNIEKFVTLICD